MTTIELPWAPSRAHPGSMHRQSTWRERAMDFNRPLPLWMRVAFMGYAHHQSNGHASFAKGELFKEFSTAAGSALVPRKLSEKQLYNALADAKEYGYLDGRSSLRCLIVPPSSVCGGLNDLRAPCGYCDGRKTGRRK